jgi:zinc transporter, ZIP family
VSWEIESAPRSVRLLRAAIALWRQPTPTIAGAIQHFAAGVVFAAAAGELLPDIKHRQSVWAVILGGVAGIFVMLLIKRLGEAAKGTLGLVVMVAVDIFIDGLVLGIGFAAGAKQGFLLTVALTTEVLFLGLSLTGELSESIRQPARVLAMIVGLAVLLPIGAAVGIPVSHLLNFWIALLFVRADPSALSGHQRTPGGGPFGAGKAVDNQPVLRRLFADLAVG